MSDQSNGTMDTISESDQLLKLDLVCLAVEEKVEKMLVGEFHCTSGIANAGYCCWRYTLGNSIHHQGELRQQRREEKGAYCRSIWFVVFCIWHERVCDTNKKISWNLFFYFWIISNAFKQVKKTDKKLIRILFGKHFVFSSIFSTQDRHPLRPARSVRPSFIPTLRARSTNQHFDINSRTQSKVGFHPLNWMEAAKQFNIPNPCMTFVFQFQLSFQQITLKPPIKKVIVVV